MYDRIVNPTFRIFPFGITTGALTLVFVFIELVMISQRRFLPGVALLGAFILLVLYITGIIETAIQLFGNGNVSNNCQTYVTNNEITGVQVNTLAWLEQNNICKLSTLLYMGIGANCE